MSHSFLLNLRALKAEGELWLKHTLPLAPLFWLALLRLVESREETHLLWEEIPSPLSEWGSSYWPPRESLCSALFSDICFPHVEPKGLWVPLLRVIIWGNRSRYPSHSFFLPGTCPADMVRSSKSPAFRNIEAKKLNILQRTWHAVPRTPYYCPLHSDGCTGGPGESAALQQA